MTLSCRLNDSTKRGQYYGMFSNDIYYRFRNNIKHYTKILSRKRRRMLHQNSNMNTALTKVADYIVNCKINAEYLNNMSVGEVTQDILHRSEMRKH